MNWIPLSSEAQLKDIVANTDQPAIIFKHSTRCSISSAALSRLERSWKEDEVAPLKAYFLDLLSYRPVSNQIARTLDIVHQSPQLLLIHDGKCVYNASHMEISYPELKKQLERIQV
jgi:bacillithiol system protein YtxJ